MLNFFFNPNGRLRRAKYLPAAFGVHLAFGFVLWIVIAGPFSTSPDSFSVAALGRILDNPATSLMDLQQVDAFVMAPALIVAAMMIWSFVVLSMKRLRDAGRSFRWMWLGLLASAWLVIALLFFPSSPGRPHRELIT